MQENRPYELRSTVVDGAMVLQYEVYTPNVSGMWVSAGSIHRTPHGNWIFLGAGGPVTRPHHQDAGQAKANDWWYN